MSVLPATVAEMLEQELERIHGVQALRHSWAFAEGHVKDDAVTARIKAGIYYNDAYAFITRTINLVGRPYWQQFNELNAALLDAEVLKTRMIPDALREMHEQVAREVKQLARFEAIVGQRPDKSLAERLTKLREETAYDIARVNRTILETLFPDEIEPAEKKHLETTVARLHEQKSSALCLSGGGIRSATFALGVLQGLARAGDAETGEYPIESVDYLSTVSGGGYIGGWLSAWILRSRRSAKTVFAELRNAAARGMSAEAGPVQWLRDYSNYLAPRFSLFSVDTGTLIATWLRNVFINWLVFLPFLAVLVLLPRIMTSLVVVANGLEGLPLLIGATLLTMLAVGMTGSALPATLHKNRPWRRRRIEIARFSGYGAALVMPLYWATVPYENTSLGGFLLYGVVIQLAGLTAPFTAEQLKSVRHFLIALGSGVASGMAGGGAFYVLTRLPWLAPPIEAPELYAVIAPPLFVIGFLLGGTTFTALTRRAAADDVHEYWNRLGASLILGALAWIVVAAIAIYGPIVLSLSPKLVAALGGITGLVGILLGKSGVSPALDKEDRGRTVSDRITATLIPVFIAILLAAISWGMTVLIAARWRGEFPSAVRAAAAKPRIEVSARVDGRDVAVNVASQQEEPLPVAAENHREILRSTPLTEVLWVTVLMAALSIGASIFADVNKFSMHALYRMRLVRAYLGASYRERNPDPFTGFDINDSVLLSELREQKPFHVVNMALNLVRGKRLAWQQRKASTFTASPLHWGNWQLGYRKADEYGMSPTGLDLGTAMTISGAAASPNMGYHSSPPLSFLLAMFNVRLGAWLGNPGVAGARMPWYDRLLALVFKRPPAWQRSSPKSSIAHQLAEAFGWTNDAHQYVYLSDGGHFENLGVYEMVLRRCRYIIVSDAGADPELQFEDLGNAVRKIRIDFGIPIDFRRFAMVSRDEKQPGAHCAIGRIRYSAADGPSRQDGYLLYIKASYYASGPQDVRQYARKVKLFPHESTADQFFTESQFESYRRLGEWVIEQIVDGRKPTTMSALFDAAFRYEAQYQEVPRW